MEAAKNRSLVRRVTIGIIGGMVLVAGIAMILLPGPAFIVIPIGLAILASEFDWAHQLMQKARTFIKRKFRRKD